MVANRLTWQNVEGPDFSTALEGMQGAGNQWAKGFDGLSGALGDWRTRQKDEASAEAMGKALGITESGNWDAAMANGGGFAAIGINSRDANPDLLNFIANRRGDLLGNEGTAANTALTGAQTAGALQNQEIAAKDQAYLEGFTQPAEQEKRAQQILEWADQNEDRARAEARFPETDAALAESDRIAREGREQVVIDKYGKEHVESVLKFNNYATLEQLMTAIGNSEDLTQPQIDAALAAAPDVFALRTAVTPDIQKEVANSTNSKNMSTWLTQAEFATGLDGTQKRLIADYELLAGTYTQAPDEALDSLFETTSSEAQKFVGADGFESNPAKMVEFFNEMMTAGTTGVNQLQPGLVAQIIKRNLTDGGKYWFGIGEGGAVDIDRERILAEIKKFSDPKKQQDMFESYQAHQGQLGQLTGLKEEQANYERMIGLAIKNKDTKQLETLEAGYKKWVEDTTGVTEGRASVEAAKNAEAAIAKAAAIGGADRAAAEAMEKKGTQDQATTPEQKAQIAADEAAGISPTMRAIQKGWAAVGQEVLNTPKNFTDLIRFKAAQTNQDLGAGIAGAANTANTINQGIGFGVSTISPEIGAAINKGSQSATDSAQSLRDGVFPDIPKMFADNMAAANAAVPSARGPLAGLFEPANAAPPAPVESIIEGGVGQFANEPASVISDMVSSSLGLSAKDAETLDLTMRQIEAGMLSEAEEAQSRDLVESLMYDALLKQNGNVSPELKSLITDMQSKYLPLDN